MRYCLFACPQHAENDVLQILGLSDLEEEVRRYLSLYFVCLGIASRLKLSGPIYAINPPSVTRFENGHNVGVDAKKCRARVFAIVRNIKDQVGLERYRAAKKTVLDNIKFKNLDPLHYVSGKSFLLYYLNGRIVAGGGKGMESRMVASYLADHSSLAHGKALVRRLRQVAAGV